MTLCKEGIRGTNGNRKNKNNKNTKKRAANLIALVVWQLRLARKRAKHCHKFVIKFAKGSGLNRRDSVEWRGRMQHSTVRLSLCPECRCQTDFYGPHRSEREAEFLLRWNLFTHRLPAPFQKILPS